MVENNFILFPKTFPTDFAATFLVFSFLSDNKLNICALVNSLSLKLNLREAIKSSNNLIHAERDVILLSCNIFSIFKSSW